MVFGMGAVAAATPVASSKAVASTASSKVVTATSQAAAATGAVAPGVSKKVASMGDCPQDCWNESAAKAKCDPNKDDKCLCGPFFDAVTSCVSQTCSVGENLQVLNTLETACDT
ncbi:hypothetical protein P280DRAFT_510213 [Massarina eburnea CBS 473.64]|uniref:CFEM domain-containing protein n=1 Tax=Massarina eburnea CBS 473.64 TaxID=1395130 RepID=A0A6A6RNU7_9PLEO|nr:hypothetical protein P280DRAFT_510213 [Massarina eburnea CBS 473.64]